MLFSPGLLARLGGLRQPVLCVEPVQAMLDRAKLNKIANIQVRHIMMVTRSLEMLTDYRLCVRPVWSSRRRGSAMTSC